MSLGFKISWVGFHGLTRAEVIRTIGCVDSGIVDEANEAPFSLAEIPGGWFILWSNDFGFVTEEALQSWSAQAAVVACQVHEGIMASISYGYERGKQQWMLMHDASNGIRDLQIAGSPPPKFTEIRARLSKEQDARGGDRAGVDVIFDIPVETARSLCAFRHDQGRFDWGEPVFTVVDVRWAPEADIPS